MEEKEKVTIFDVSWEFRFASRLYAIRLVFTYRYYLYMNRYTPFNYSKKEKDLYEKIVKISGESDREEKRDNNSIYKCWEFKFAGWLYVKRLSFTFNYYYYMDRYTPFNYSKEREEVYKQIMTDYD